MACSKQWSKGDSSDSRRSSCRHLFSYWALVSVPPGGPAGEGGYRCGVDLEGRGGLGLARADIEAVVVDAGDGLRGIRQTDIVVVSGEGIHEFLINSI